MMLVFQIAAGIVIAFIAIFLVYCLLLNWAEDMMAERKISSYIFGESSGDMSAIHYRICWTHDLI